MVSQQQESFDDLVKKAWNEGIRNNDVVYDDFKPVLASDQGIPFEVRYLPTLEEKSKAGNDDNDNDGEDNKDNKHQDDKKESEALHPLARASTDAEEEKGVETRDEDQGKVADNYEPEGIDPSDDPFAPPRKAVICSVPPEFVCMLNKYSLEKGHFLAVTNEFVPQTGAVRPQDLVMLHEVVQRPSNRTYAFLNGGPDAGASQKHRHFQFMEVPDLGEPVWPDAIFNASPKSTEPQSHPAIPIAHFLLPILDASEEGLVRLWQKLFALAKTMAETDDEEMPFNFLMTREYMMILPRKQSNWEDISIGGTVMVGSIPVEDPKYLDVVKETGIIEIMRHVGYPKHE
jgi:ATP adenylyltransferase